MKKNKQKVVRPKPINPKGFRDYFHFFSKKRSSLIKEICEVFELYGFENLETPAIENLDALGKYLPDMIDQIKEFFLGRMMKAIG